MPTRRMSVAPDTYKAPLAPITERIDELIRGAGVSEDFPGPVLAEARRAESEWRERTAGHVDMTDVEFVTLDPAGATDLDQAVRLDRLADGYRVRYAIADLPLFVETDAPIDREARERGLTIYLPDRRIPLHPTVISEGAGSLLPGQDAPAFVWDFDLDREARIREVTLTRAIVRNREQLDYDSVQASLDEGRGHAQMLLLQEVGEKRGVLEIERGGASLGSPELQVETDDSHVSLDWRVLHPIEQANAQISLMTGMTAADIMLKGGVGVLRTMPPASKESIETFRAQAAALKEEWSEDMPYGAFLRTLDWSKGRHLALLNQATKLFRGAGYEVFTEGRKPADPRQAALAAPYAHTTAPLRRLVDRFSLILCHALVNGLAIDPAIIGILPQVPSLMGSAGSRNSQLERDARDIVEIGVLATIEGQELRGTVIDVREGKQHANGKEPTPTRVNVQFAEPPIARWVPIDDSCTVSMGTRVRATVGTVSIEEREATFVDLAIDDEREGKLPA